MTKRLRLGFGAAAVIVAAVLAPLAHAEPLPPPGPGSSNDDLTDMVLDAIEHGSPSPDPVAPSTTPVPSPIP